MSSRIQTENFPAKEFRMSSSAESSIQLLSALDSFLADKSYFSGFSPSKLDADVWRRLSEGRVLAKSDDAVDPSLPHLRRWWHHISSFSVDDRLGFPTGSASDEAVVISAFPILFDCSSPLTKMVKRDGEPDLDAAQKWALISRNLQETLGEDRIKVLWCRH